MAHSTQTLLDYLTTPNPPVNNVHSWPGSNTKSTGSKWCSYTTLEDWEDFKFDTLNKLHKDLLHLEFSQEDLPDFNQKIPYHLTEIRSENTLNSLLIRWNNAVVSAALAASQDPSLKDVGSCRGGGEIFMACGCQATVVPRKELKHNKKVPDWAGIIKDDVRELQEGKRKRITHVNLLPGDTKLSTKWKSKSIKKAKNNSETKAPINQVLTYCANAQVRYGYIITQEELVVFRVSERLKPFEVSLPKRGQKQIPVETQLGEDPYEWHMEYKAIPWESDDGAQSGDLTVNLALWWLHILAAQERSMKVTYSTLRTEYLASDAGDSQVSSFEGKGSQLEEDTNSDLEDSQLSPFNNKRRRDDDETSLDVALGRVGKGASKRRGNVQPHDISMSFESQLSV